MLIMLETFFEPELEQLAEEQDLGDIWFQQDGATAHTVIISMTKLADVPLAPRLSERWPGVVRKITGFEHLRFFPVGLPQEKGLQKLISIIQRSRTAVVWLTAS